MVTSQPFSTSQIFEPDQFVGNHPALDFVNTMSHRRDPAQNEDRLGDTHDLKQWAIAAGVVKSQPGSPSHDADDNATAIHEIRALRECAHDLLLTRIEGRPPQGADVTAIAAHLGDSTEAVSFDVVGTLAGCVAKDTSVESIRKTLTLLILDAVFRLPIQRVRVCPACGWLFHDTSRGGRRQWCSMRTCGNRTKVRQHRKTASKREISRLNDD